jgi:hypothetical protein
MLFTLALRHLLVQKRRGAFLLLGFGIGAGVMMVLLSIGQAMLLQSEDVSLVGGGEVTVLPEGIDLEGLRTGSVRGLLFGIDRARFVHRQLLEGPRYRDWVAASAPAIEQKLVYLSAHGETVPVRAGGEIPSRAAAVGADLRILEGAWHDTAQDSAFVSPSPQQLYDELDHFHLPRRRDSTWAEWHYFNVVIGPDEWWYITYIVGGDLLGGRWGGSLLITRHLPGGDQRRYQAIVPPEAVRFDTARADLTLGSATVRQRDGRYLIRGRAAGPSGTVGFDLTVTPTPNVYFPALELAGDRFQSGYVVPALRATAAGRVCDAERCHTIEGAAAYHDHNWGTWGGVTWEWGQARGEASNVVYGGVRAAEAGDASEAPFFLALLDSSGVRSVLRFDRIEYEGKRPVSGAPGVSAPERFTVRAAQGKDTVRLQVSVETAQATRAATAGFQRYFLQLRGAFVLEGTVAGAPLRDRGRGFFETYVERP